MLMVLFSSISRSSVFVPCFSFNARLLLRNGKKWTLFWSNAWWWYWFTRHSALFLFEPLGTCVMCFSLLGLSISRQIACVKLAVFAVFWYIEWKAKVQAHLHRNLAQHRMTKLSGRKCKLCWSPKGFSTSSGGTAWPTSTPRWILV